MFFVALERIIDSTEALQEREERVRSSITDPGPRSTQQSVDWGKFKSALEAALPTEDVAAFWGAWSVGWLGCLFCWWIRWLVGQAKLRLSKIH